MGIYGIYIYASINSSEKNQPEMYVGKFIY